MTASEALRAAKARPGKIGARRGPPNPNPHASSGWPNPIVYEGGVWLWTNVYESFVEDLSPDDVLAEDWELIELEGDDGGTG